MVVRCNSARAGRYQVQKRDAKIRQLENDVTDANQRANDRKVEVTRQIMCHFYNFCLSW